MARASTRPLRARGVLAQILLVVLVELVVLATYRSHDSRFHWAVHFLVAVTVAAAWAALHLLVMGRPSRFFVLAVLPLHAVAMFPDVLFTLGVPHARWMDVFLLHITSHHLPGGDLGWLLVAGAAVLGATALLAAWSGARRDEVHRGLLPASGFGGAAVVRPQLDPSTPLARVVAGPGPTRVVLVHGLGGAASTWATVQRDLAEAGVASLAVDLPGHGRSMRIATSYGLSEQAAALVGVLRLVGGPVVLVGHSYGTAVSAAATCMAPELVAHLVLVAPPAFDDSATAAAALSTGGWLARTTVEERTSAAVVCGTMCALRVVMGHAAHRIEPDVPAEVARDGTHHSFPAYQDGVDSLLNANPLPQALAAPAVPTSVLLGAHDTTAPVEAVLALPRVGSVQVEVLEGGHRLPLTHPHEVAAAVLAVTEPVPPLPPVPPRRKAGT
ncbi:MAG: alpha/beta fold hydrolase [Motilibacteraceae bacterium]